MSQGEGIDTVKVSTLWRGKNVNGQFVAEKIVSIGLSDEELRRVLIQSTPTAHHPG
jgi:hypothetical protein